MRVSTVPWDARPTGSAVLLPVSWMMVSGGWMMERMQRGEGEAGAPREGTRPTSAGAERGQSGEGVAACAVFLPVSWMMEGR